MSKTFFNKSVYRKKRALRDELAKSILENNDIPEREAMMSCKEQRGVKEYELSRHSKGTKAGGLRSVYKGWRVCDFRRRFGEIEESSSRLRLLRRKGKHSARLQSKQILKKEVVLADFFSEGED